MKSMEFNGFVPISIDDKNRLKFPVQFQRVYQESYGEQDNSLVTCITTRKSIAIVPKPYFPEFAKQFEVSGPAGNVASPFLLAMRITYNETTPDAQGRMKLSRKLLDRVGISKEAMLCGFGAYLELYAEQAWNEYIDAAMNTVFDTQQNVAADKKLEMNNMFLGIQTPGTNTDSSESN